MQQERYKRVFSLPAHLHCNGFPFEIEAGALLVDSQTDGILAQMKMASHADKRVKAVKVTLQPEDTRGKALGDEISHQYLDLDVVRGASFGQKTPVHLPDSSTRSFSVSGVEVVYTDNSVAISGGAWEPLPEQKELSATISDEETLKQYRVDFGDGCLYRLQEFDDIWRCACGAVNRDDEEVCYNCGQRREALRSIDPSVIEEHKAARLEAERVEREAQLERERLEKEESDKKAAKAKRTRTIVMAIGAAVVAAFVAFVFWNSNRAPGKADFGPESIFNVYELNAMSADEVAKYTEASALNFHEETGQRKEGYRVYGFSLGKKLNEALRLRDGQMFGLTDDENNDFTCIMWYTTAEYALQGYHTSTEWEAQAKKIINDISPSLNLGTLSSMGNGKGPDGATDWIIFKDQSQHNYVCVKFYTDGAAILVGNKV